MRSDWGGKSETVNFVLTVSYDNKGNILSVSGGGYQRNGGQTTVEVAGWSL